MAGGRVNYDRPILLGCGQCDARWTALSAAHCAGCHRTFASVDAGFDTHRVAGRCVAPETVGLRVEGGYWLAPGETAPGKVMSARDNPWMGDGG